MHPLFNQELANQHREELEHSAAQSNGHGEEITSQPLPDRFPLPNDTTKTSYGRRLIAVVLGFI
jgi:hypothetical protein